MTPTPGEARTATAREIIARHLFQKKFASYPSFLWDKCDQSWRDVELEGADAILSALAAAGKTVVPIEPSDEMVVRGDECLIEELNKMTFALNGGDTPALKTWRAMLAADE